MKTILSIIAMAVIVTACNSNASVEKEVAARMKAHKDSLRLDSFEKAEVVKKEEAVDAVERHGNTIHEVNSKMWMTALNPSENG